MKRYLLLCCILVVVATTLLADPSATVVRLDRTHQVIVDFGASDCWLGDYVGRYFSSTMKERAAKMLFARSFDRGGNPEGIGLSNWRVNLGAGSATQGSDSNIDDPTRRTECYLNDDGVTYNWSHSAGQQYFMQKALDYGVENILFFSNSAPIYYTANGKANKVNMLPWGANLRDDAYDDFAEYMATVTKHFVDLGYPISYISPVNEPQYEWTSGQEGSPWYNTEVTQLVKELDEALTRHGLSTKILIPEAGKWNYLTESNAIINNYGYDQINQFFNPSQTSTYVGNLAHVANAVAGHSYWTFRTNTELVNRRTAVATAAAQMGVQVYQTEWSMLDEPPTASAGFPSGGYEEATYMDIALYMGKVIYCDMVYANASSWSYWTAFAQEQWGQKNRFYLLRVLANGDSGPESYGDLTNGGTILDNRNLWVLGNYSRFIRPGYTRVELSGADNLNALMGSAYVSPDGNEVVVVYVNMANSPSTVTLTAEADDGRVISTIKKYTTSESLALHFDRNLPETYVSGQEVEIPARSVVTLLLGLTKDQQHLQGDVNGDGLVDIDDVNAIINAILGITEWHSDYDLTGDGIVDVDDVNAIINIILRIQ
ncbi:MAG: xylanase [Muribaculaceae bacterium]|nr:xylanase [Muribaculaceae bacterium]